MNLTQRVAILESAQSISNKNSESLSCVIASTSSDFEQINRLWHEVYVKEMGWLQTKSNDLFNDRYHPYSVYLLARIDEIAVGTLRLVFDSSIGLPVEQFFQLGLLKINHKFVEGQRMMVSSYVRQRKLKCAPFGLLMNLTKAAFHYCFMSGVTHILADTFTDTPTTPIKAFKALGFEEVGCAFTDTELSDSSKSVALILGMDRLITKAYTARGKLFKYLLEFDPTFHFYDSNFVKSDECEVKL